MYGKLLSRQVRRAFGAGDPAAFLEALSAQANSCPPEVGDCLRALPDFMRMVDAAYAQNERDLDLRSRSLQLSSAELGEVNSKLRSKAALQAKALETLRATVTSMWPATSADGEAGLAASGDIEELSTLIQRLAEERRIALARLAVGEEKLRSLAELSSDWYWEQDAELRFVASADRKGRESVLSGSVASIGMRRWEIPDSVPIDGSWQEHRALLSERKPFRNFRIRRTDAAGVEHIVSVSGLPVYGTDGAFAGYRGVGSDVTEAVQAQREVERARRFMSTVINAIPSPIFVKDEDSRWIVLNDAMCAFMGRSREELVGKGDADFFPAAEAEVFRARDLMVLESGLPNENEESFTDAAGKQHWILTRKRAFDLDDGKRILVGVIADITEIKAKEAALKESEAKASRLALVASNTTNAVIITDHMGKIEWVNQGFVKLTGYLLQEAIGNTAARLLHGPDTDHDAVARIRKCVDDGHSLRTEILHYAKSGQPFWADLELQLVRDEAGAVAHVVSLQSDITERKRAEAALKQSEAKASRLAMVASRTNNAVIITDALGRIDWVNDAFTKLTGYALAEVAGRSPGSFLQGPETDPEEVRRVGQLVRAGSGFKCEIVNYAKDGRKYWLAIDAQALRDGQGCLIGFIAIESDVSERKAAEALLRRAKESAESASRAKSEFVANMSHEIRTPMNGVLGMTELLLDTELTEGQRRYAKNIRNSADALLNIINDILDFSKIEAGKMELDPVDFDVRELAEEVAEMAAGRAHAKGIELLCRIDGAVPAAVRGDAGRLRQVLTNLVGNAVKFTTKGEVLVEVRMARHETSGSDFRLEFSIIDTGIGISEEAMRRLFMAFSQADSSTTRRFGGTGLGLAISRQLVRLMGGEIEVESMPNHGSHFRFSLRMESAEAAVADWVPRDDLRGLKVLIVEDNLNNSEILLHHARSWGMHATVVHDAEKALAVAGEASRGGKRFDLALIDWKLPGMNGIDLAKALRAANGADAARMILLTSMTTSNVAQMARQAGFSGYLNKPLRREELYRAVARSMGINAVPAKAENEPTGAVSSGGHALLVEDNLVNQDIGAAMLGSLGMSADIANNGIEAVALFGRNKYDLILMDCQMPEMDGFAATAEIRARESASGGLRTPIVALTANAMQGDRERCLAAGMDDYLAKPFSKTQLAAIAVRWMAQAGMQAAESGRQSVTARTAPSLPEIPEVAVLDQTALANIRALERPGMPSLLARVVERYLDDAGRFCEQMRAALKGGDGEAIARAAHTLKSASANVGARRPAELCKVIEMDAREGDVAALEGLLDELDIALRHVGGALRDEITEAA